MKKEKEPTIRDVVELIDKLASTVANGFERTATKTALQEVKSELKAEMEALKVDIGTVKRDVAFVRSNFVNREEFEELVKRVIFLENRVGTKLGTRKLA